MRPTRPKVVGIWLSVLLLAGLVAAAAQSLAPGRALRSGVVQQVLGAEVGDLGLGAHRSTQGTLVTLTDGSNSNRPLSRSAVWLCSRFCHQCSTTYSGITTETTSPGFSRSS